MTNFANGHTTVLAGHGFAESGPYLLINDVEQGEQHRFPVLGKTFSLRRLPTRRCVGRFDLASYTKEVCPLNVELLPDAKDTMCPACQEATGFNLSLIHISGAARSEPRSSRRAGVEKNHAGRERGGLATPRFAIIDGLCSHRCHLRFSSEMCIRDSFMAAYDWARRKRKASRKQKGRRES